jgi:hypothetical protein
MQAILWAGQDASADIISMSFGLAFDDEELGSDITTVQRQRRDKIIFMASAGNSSTDNESFPARHPSVISIYATDYRGSFLTSNAASTGRGAAVLGTYGDNIPDRLKSGFANSNICKPGSSVATAIMAGIGATMLMYVQALPCLVTGTTSSDPILRLIWTTKGMDAVLCRIAQENIDRPRLKPVKPVWFWKHKPSDLARYCVIYDALSDVRPFIASRDS